MKKPVLAQRIVIVQRQVILLCMRIVCAMSGEENLVDSARAYVFFDISGWCHPDFDSANGRMQGCPPRCGRYLPPCEAGKAYRRLLRRERRTSGFPGK